MFLIVPLAIYCQYVARKLIFFCRSLGTLLKIYKTAFYPQTNLVFISFDCEKAIGKLFETPTELYISIQTTISMEIAQEMSARKVGGEKSEHLVLFFGTHGHAMHYIPYQPFPVNI